MMQKIENYMGKRANKLVYEVKMCMIKPRF